MTDDPGDLYALLSEPVIPDDPPRRTWPWWVASLLAVVVLVVALVSGDETDGAATTTLPGDTAAVSTSDPTSTDPTSAATTLPEPEYPGSRLHASLAATPDGVLMFGGREASRTPPVSDTWLFSDGVWSHLALTLEPPPREVAPMVFSPALDRVVLVGGSPDTTAGCGVWTRVIGPTVDVWTFDPEALVWERIDTGSAPDDRWAHSIAADLDSGRIVVFGGVSFGTSRNTPSTLDETWVFDVATAEWTRLETEVSPGGLACAGMTTDPESGLVYLWAGQPSMSRTSDALWAFDFDAGSWTEIETSGTPKGRWLHVMVPDPAGNGILVFGGFGPRVTATDSGTITSLASLDEVWRLDLQTFGWEQRAPLPASTAWLSAAPTGDGRVVVYSADDTWLYDPVMDVWIDVTPDEYAG